MISDLFNDDYKKRHKKHKHHHHTLRVILSGTARPLNSISWIISITRWRSSGSGEVSPDSGIIFQPFRPPNEGFIEKLISPGTADVVEVVEAAIGVEHRAGVPALDRDPDRSRLSRKFRARRASLWISRARLEPGLWGVEGLNNGESGATGLFFLEFATLTSILRLVESSEAIAMCVWKNLGHINLHIWPLIILFGVFGMLLATSKKTIAE